MGISEEKGDQKEIQLEISNIFLDENLMKFLTDLNRNLIDGEDVGFLDRETIYKLKERKK